MSNKNFDITKYIGWQLGQKKFDVKKYCINNYGKNLTKKILEKTGPSQLYHCDKNQNSLILALEAWKKIKNKINISKVKNLIFISETNINQFPGNGYLFGSENEFDENILVFDVNAGCTGFVDGLILAESLKGNSLIVCSETYSKNIHNFDRSTSTLFSDCSTVFYYDKNVFKLTKYKNFMKKNSYNDLIKKNNSTMFMDGMKVFNFVSSNVITKLTNFLKKNKYNSIIESLYLHQASKVVIDFIKSKEVFKEIRIPSNISKIGNTVSSSIPMLMLYDKKKINSSKNKIALCGFGVGLACSIAILEIKK